MHPSPISNAFNAFIIIQHNYACWANLIRTAEDLVGIFWRTKLRKFDPSYMRPTVYFDSSTWIKKSSRIKTPKMWIILYPSSPKLRTPTNRNFGKFWDFLWLAFFLKLGIQDFKRNYRADEEKKRHFWEIFRHFRSYFLSEYWKSKTLSRSSFSQKRYWKDHDFV